MKLFKIFYLSLKSFWREILLIILITTLSITICVLLLYKFNLSENLFDNLVGGITSAGILGFFAALLVYTIQKRSDIQQQKSAAEIFYYARLLPDLHQLFTRNVSPWNVNGNNKFYFDNSWVNYVYDLYDKYTELIFSYDSFFPNNKIIECITKIHLKVSKGYVLGEKIDQFLFEQVRDVHAKDGLIEEVDIYLLRYLKSRLFTNKSEAWAEAHTGWTPVRQYYPEVYKSLTEKIRVIKMRRNIKEIRIDLEKDVKNLQSMI